MRRQGSENTRLILGYVVYANERIAKEPQADHGREGQPHNLRAKTLDEEQTDQDPDRDACDGAL